MTWQINKNINFVLFLKKHRLEIFQFLILFIPNFIAWIVFYPGYFQADHQSLIANIINGTPNQGNSLVWGYLSLPFFYLAPTYAFYGIFQILIFVFCIIFGIKRLQNCQFVKHPLIITFIFALFPTFIFYNLLYSSEIILAYLVFDLSCLFIEYAFNKKNNKQSNRFWLWLFVFLTLCCLIRKTAILIPVFLILFVFVFKDANKKRFLLMSLSCVLVVFSFSFIFEKLLSASTDAYQGGFSVIPAYQVAGVYCSGGYIPDDAREVFENIKSEQDWKDSYLSATSDKAQEKVSMNPDFIEAYINTGFHNVKSYIKSYFRLENPLYLFSYNLGFDLKVKDDGVVLDFQQHDKFTLALADSPDSNIPQRYTEQFGVSHSDIWYSIPQTVADSHLSEIGIYPATFDVLLLNRALPFWILIIGFVISLKKRKTKQYILCSLPVFSIWLVFAVCCPVVLFRYVAEMYYSLPLLILVVIKIIKSSKIDNL